MLSCFLCVLCGECSFRYPTIRLESAARVGPQEATMRQAARVVLAVATLAAPARAQVPVPVPVAPPAPPQPPVAWALKLFDVEGKVQGHDFGPAARGVLLVHRFP